MAWAQYIMNEFIDDFLDAQNSKKKFHYSWILPLHSMVLWQHPQGFERPSRSQNSFEDPHFSRLHESKDPGTNESNENLFQSWYKQLILSTTSQENIPGTLMDKSDGYLLFEYTFHYMFIYPNDDWGTTMALIPFFITEEDIQQGVVE
jgi:hypothetical protein